MDPNVDFHTFPPAFTRYLRRNLNNKFSTDHRVHFLRVPQILNRCVRRDTHKKFSIVFSAYFFASFKVSNRDRKKHADNSRLCISDFLPSSRFEGMAATNHHGKQEYNQEVIFRANAGFQALTQSLARTRWWKVLQIPHSISLYFPEVRMRDRRRNIDQGQFVSVYLKFLVFLKISRNNNQNHNVSMQSQRKQGKTKHFPEGQRKQ